MLYENVMGPVDTLGYCRD